MKSPLDQCVPTTPQLINSAVESEIAKSSEIMLYPCKYILDTIYTTCKNYVSDDCSANDVETQSVASGDEKGVRCPCTYNEVRNKTSCCSKSFCRLMFFA